MKEKERIRLDDFISSFREIWRYDKRLFLVLLLSVFVTALQPFPTIIFSGLYINESAFQNCERLVKITFGGTVEEWNAIEKGTDWDEGTGDYTVYCTNGNTTK